MVHPTGAPSLSSFLLVSCACLLMLLLLACPLPASAQSYHYSNGWNPGKRGGYGAASGLATTDSGAEDDLCLFRPKVLAFINRVIMDEVSRIEQMCYPVDAVSGLKALLQQSAAAQSLSSAGAKMSDENAKASW